MSHGDFSMLRMIQEKRAGQAHAPATLAAFVAGLVAGELVDYQVAAWLMAVVWRGMTLEETTELTRLVAASGDVLDLSALPGPKVDKHSTGGVGDKVTLVLGPLLAAGGATVAKLSGRGLGHTGGTADKVEAIPGFQVALPEERFLAQLGDIRIALASQTQSLAPADGILYALRDVTATVDSIPLIAVSVLSKKVASGADVILLDVKAGSGAFMPDVASAKALSEVMLEVGARLGKRVICVVTGMDQPLGRAVGHANEVAEAIATLKGEGPEDLTELCLHLGAHLMVGGHLAEDLTQGEAMLRAAIADGRALAKLRELIVAQGGDPRVVDDPTLMPQSRERVVVVAPRAGWVARLDAMGIAKAAKALGGGRDRKADPIDLAVGVQLLKKEGDAVAAGEPLAELLVNAPEGVGEAKALILAAYELSDLAPAPKALIQAVLGPSVPVSPTLQAAP